MAAKGSLASLLPACGQTGRDLLAEPLMLSSAVGMPNSWDFITGGQHQEER